MNKLSYQQQLHVCIDDLADFLNDTRELMVEQNQKIKTLKQECEALKKSIFLIQQKILSKKDNTLDRFSQITI